MVCFCCFPPFAYVPELVFSFLAKVFFLEKEGMVIFLVEVTKFVDIF